MIIFVHINSSIYTMLLFPYMPPHIQWIGESATTPQISGIREAQSSASSAPFEMPYMIIFSCPLFFSHRIAFSNGSTGTRTNSFGHDKVVRSPPVQPSHIPLSQLSLFLQLGLLSVFSFFIPFRVLFANIEITLFCALCKCTCPV